MTTTDDYIEFRPRTAARIDLAIAILLLAFAFIDFEHVLMNAGNLLLLALGKSGASPSMAAIVTIAGAAALRAPLCVAYFSMGLKLQRGIVGYHFKTAIWAAIHLVAWGMILGSAILTRLHSGFSLVHLFSAVEGAAHLAILMLLVLAIRRDEATIAS